MIRFLSVLFTLFCLGFPASAQQTNQEIVSPTEQVWASYANPRFGVSASLPSVGFVPQPLSENGDGISLLSVSGQSTITVFGSYWAATSNSFSDYRAQQGHNLENLGANITYAPGGNSWFVFSGYLGDDIFYFKSTTRSNCPVAGHIYFKFPAIYKDQMSYIIERMEDSLHLGPSEACPG